MRTKLVLLLTCALTGVRTLLAAPQAANTEEQERESARRGIYLLMDGDPDSAIEAFRQIGRDEPKSALGYLLEADATWWKIYLTTANLIDPDVFDVARSETTPYDSRLEDLINVAIHRSAARLRAHQDEARNYLYEGLAYALRARLAGLRDHDLPTARAGKKMRTLLLAALKLDPNLADAYLGVGIYNYFVDTLPTIIKLLKFLIALPGGNRELGLQQLQQAADRGEFTRGEAKFYLAKDFSRGNERQYAKSLELFQQLAEEYPHNLLWRLLAGSLEIRLGQVQQGEDLYREVLTKSMGLQSEVGRALHQQAEEALARRHTQ